MTGNSILQYQFTLLPGLFTPLDPAGVLPPAGTGPRHLVFHGSKRYGYVVNETGNNVTCLPMTDTFPAC